MADVVDTKAAYEYDEGEEKAFVHKHSNIDLPRDISDAQLKFWMQSEGLMFLQNELYCLKYTDLYTITTDEVDLLSQNLEQGQKIRFRNAVNQLKNRGSLRATAASKPAPTTYKEIFKVILVGDCNVGKSSILSRFIKDEFEILYETTVGLQREDQIIEAPQKNVKLQIFDTSGSHEFGTISKAFFRQSHGVFIIYDVTNQQSFDNITNLIEKVKMQVDEPNDDEKKAWKMIIANKCDLENQRIITKQQGQQLADQHGIKFMECSAKTGANIDAMFGVMTQYLLHVWDESATPKNDCCCVLL